MAEEKTEVKTGEETAGVTTPTESIEKTPDQEQEELLKSILESGKEEPVEKKDETLPEEEIEEYDREELEKEFPFLKMEQFKDKNLKEILSSYGGGIEALNKAGDIIKALEEAGITNPQAQREAILKLKAGGDITKTPEQLKSEQPKTFEEFRKAKLSELIPKKITGENGSERDLTPEEKSVYQSDWENKAERIFPSHLGNTIQNTEGKVLDMAEEMQWLRFKLKPIFEANKDIILGDEIRTQINQHFLEKYPMYAQKIITKAQKEGKPWYEILYNEYIVYTKGDEIAKKKVDKLLEEREKEAKKRASAITESKTKEKLSLQDKPFDQMTQAERFKWIQEHG